MGYGILRRRKRTVLTLQRESFFSNADNGILFNSGFGCLSKFAFKCSVQ